MTWPFSIPMSSEYAVIPSAEPEEEDSAPPPNVVAAARSLFYCLQRRPPESDAEALLFVKRTLDQKAEAAAAAAAGPAEPASSGDNEPVVPPGVLAAAHNIFERNNGRPANDAMEALTFVHGVVSKVKEREQQAVEEEMLASDPTVDDSDDGAATAPLVRPRSSDAAEDSEAEVHQNPPGRSGSALPQWCETCEGSACCRCVAFWCGMTPCTMWRAYRLPYEQSAERLVRG